ncbi:hypothetical protein PB2503_10649 [Parvularcula bermudensis HTCC2503]|uniref:PilZ domain-containing protein n=1 Tax=Parvularcula bermudensis (strain ATCC BAA-594 / HTCC2503 / KCTC 12087) TaxID=314260 RepID=E0TH91_PARBH|nr:hypothetical protein [Parvularcula bermudensis]ADM10181.1 hypothetical protein PB2503_10649 [Parvularcula bermudensis HTCC2503]
MIDFKSVHTNLHATVLIGADEEWECRVRRISAKGFLIQGVQGQPDEGTRAVLYLNANERFVGILRQAAKYFATLSISDQQRARAIECMDLYEGTAPPRVANRIGDEPVENRVRIEPKEVTVLLKNGDEVTGQLTDVSRSGLGVSMPAVLSPTSIVTIGGLTLRVKRTHTLGYGFELLNGIARDISEARAMDLILRAALKPSDRETALKRMTKFALTG